MPKYQKSTDLRRYDPLLTIIAGTAVCKYGRLDYEALAAESGLSQSTLRRRLKEPENFSLAELVALRRVLGCEPEKLQEALRL